MENLDRIQYWVATAVLALLLCLVMFVLLGPPGRH